MTSAQTLKLVLAALVALAVAAVVIAVLLATDTILSIWERLAAVAPWAVVLYVLVLVVAAGLTAWLVLRLFFFRERREEEPPADPEALAERIRASEARGVNVAAAAQELEELERRRAADDRLYVALFGQVSVGKSALMNALAPGARQASDPRAGTTREIHTFDWDPPRGAPVRLVDVPGFGQADGDRLAERAREEALRAHVVVYVSDGDLDRAQHQELAALAHFGKPILVALNKADRYSPAELESIETRLRETAPAEAELDLVPVSAGGREEVIVVTAAGEERRELRERPPDTARLVAAIARRLAGDPVRLDARREASVLALANVKLGKAEARHRSQAAAALVDKYARRAVVGALAAVTPGSDLVIQGALATKLVSDLCRLYEVPLKELDVDRFLELAGTRLRRTTAIVLAVSGNALKAFPGVGTVVGGLVHAVAYGMIFDSLGRAIAEALAAGGPVRERAVADRFERLLTEGGDQRSLRFARLALKAATGENPERTGGGDAATSRKKPS